MNCFALHVRQGAAQNTRTKGQQLTPETDESSFAPRYPPRLASDR